MLHSYGMRLRSLVRAATRRRNRANYNRLRFAAGMAHEPGSLLAALAHRLRGARRVAILTGAGVSAASGVPTFRGANGLWRRYRPEDLATARAFARDPALVWEWYAWRRAAIAACAPNPAHVVIARWSTQRPG